MQPKVTVLCNPNNPTGELLPMAYVEAVLQASENPVVIDEAYLEFAGVPSIITKLSNTTTSSLSGPCPKLGWPAAVSVTAWLKIRHRGLGADETCS